MKTHRYDGIPTATIAKKFMPSQSPEQWDANIIQPYEASKCHPVQKTDHCQTALEVIAHANHNGQNVQRHRGNQMN